MQPETYDSQIGNVREGHIESRKVKPHTFFKKYLARNFLAALSILILLSIPVTWLISGSMKHSIIFVVLSGICYALASHINIHLHRNKF
ncbi:MAG: hypothetical protein ACRBBN_06360 [Methyloligellaceae bacterium]